LFKGKAELTDPEKGHVVATFNETCHDDGTANATIIRATLISYRSCLKPLDTLRSNCPGLAYADTDLQACNAPLMSAFRLIMLGH
jgi:hypothetical protein